MEDAEIEKMVAAGDYGLEMDSVSRKEYPFARKYLRAPNADVREVLARLLLHVGQPWTFPLFVEMLRDPLASVRALAVEGIYRLSLHDKKEEVFREIGRMQAELPEEDRDEVGGLVLTLGNIGGKDDVEKLLALSKSAPGAALRIEYQKALAKLGFKKAVREIELELIASDGFGKDQGLRKVEYINRPEWIEKVKPLLLDEQIGRSAPMGPIHVTHRVCDLAVNVLRKIDPEKRIRFPDKPLGVHYAPEEMRQTRETYGVAAEKR